jgi:Flp pilus assembly pilin Flp
MALINALRSFARRSGRLAGEAGAALVEYTLLVALIAVVAITAITMLGSSAKNTLCDAGNTIDAAADVSCDNP